MRALLRIERPALGTQRRLTHCHTVPDLRDAARRRAVQLLGLTSVRELDSSLLRRR